MKISMDELDKWIAQRRIDRAVFCELVTLRTGVIVKSTDFTSQGYRNGYLSKWASMAVRMVLEEIEHYEDLNQWVTTIMKKRLKKTLSTDLK